MRAFYKANYSVSFQSHENDAITFEFKLSIGYSISTLRCDIWIAFERI